MADHEIERDEELSLPEFIRATIEPFDPLRIVGRLVRRRTKAPGSPPGTLVHTGPRRVDAVTVQAIRYGPDGSEVERWDRIPEPLPVPSPGEGVLWMNVEGLHDVELLESVAAGVGIHPLAIEDVANVGQRPKLEEYSAHLFIVAHMLRVQEAQIHILDEQVSLVVGPGYLISFQEGSGDVFGPVRRRIESGKGQIRSRSSAYLAYALLDALVDSLFVILEQFGEHVETMELQVVEDPTKQTMRSLHHLKRELLVLRRSVWPLRELASSFQRVERDWIEPAVTVYIRDLHDHCYQLIDTVEILREISSGLRDLYLSNLSHRTNEVMKVLTVIASVFIPLTFVAGVYGMNFEHMPELAFPWAYPAVLLLMGLIAGGMLTMFRVRRWI
ncbi:MAG: magnesium and cobalt transport protein CorA [Gemmatimonadales bacterium]|nr:MAG: magnesium and cobalt transport protein CorA [Gemmatimonadales bacterium]